MQRPEMLHEDSVPSLLREGLEAYGRGDTQGAIAAWQKVLQLEPSNTEALDYLDSAGVQPTTATAQVIDISSARAQKSPPQSLTPDSGISRTVERHLCQERLKELLRRGHHEAALELLRQEKTKTPDDNGIDQAITLLEQRLSAGHLEELGGETSLPSLTRKIADGSFNVSSLSPLQRDIASRIDGRTPVKVLLQRSDASPFQALEALTALTRLGLCEHTQRQEAPPTSRTTGRAPTAPVQDEYSRLFELATKAYLARRLKEAVQLFEKCRNLRPDDARAEHNLKAISRRLGS